MDAEELNKAADLYAFGKQCQSNHLYDEKSSKEGYIDGYKASEKHNNIHFSLNHDYDWEWYQPLFDLMESHNVTMLQGEMDEVINVVSKMIGAK